MEWIVSIGVGLFLFFKFPKPMLVLIGLIVVTVGGFIGYDQWEQYQRAQRTEKLVIIAEYSKDHCTPEFPILVSMKNGSDWRVTKVSFDLSGRLPDYSTPLYQQYIESDRILDAGEEFSTCYSLPRTNVLAEAGRIQAAPIEFLVWNVGFTYPIFTKP